MPAKKTLPAVDAPRMRVALLMVSDLFGGGQIPQPGASIASWAKHIQVQISWAAQLNNSGRPLQFGFGWDHVYASDIAGCKLIEDLIGLVYSKLKPAGDVQVAGEDIESYLAHFTGGD